MQKSRGNIQLSSYDDIFGFGDNENGSNNNLDGENGDIGKEKVTDIALSDLYPFKDHNVRGEKVRCRQSYAKK